MVEGVIYDGTFSIWINIYKKKERAAEADPFQTSPLRGGDCTTRYTTKNKPGPMPAAQERQLDHVPVRESQRNFVLLSQVHLVKSAHIVPELGLEVWSQGRKVQFRCSSQQEPSAKQRITDGATDSSTPKDGAWTG